MNNLDMTLPQVAPSATRPLLGLTVLLVEDSRFASEAIRMMCQRSGARLRRADSIHHARHHLRTYRPGAVIIDLGLPDGDGASFIEELANAKPRVELLIGTSGDEAGERRTLAAGADGFIAKPVQNLASFQTAILDLMPSERRPSGPRALDLTSFEPDQLAYHDDLRQMTEALTNWQDRSEIGYAAQFIESVATAAGDRELAALARDLGEHHSEDEPILSRVALITSALAHRMRKLEQSEQNRGHC